MKYLMVLAVAVIAWIAGGILLYPTLHWKGLLGAFLVMFAYRLEVNYPDSQKRKLDTPDDLIKYLWSKDEKTKTR